MLLDPPETGAAPGERAGPSAPAGAGSTALSCSPLDFRLPMVPPVDYDAEQPVQAQAPLPPPPQQMSATDARAARRAAARRSPVPLRDKSMLRVAESLHDERCPGEVELASEAKLQRHLRGESASSVGPVRRSAHRMRTSGEYTAGRGLSSRFVDPGELEVDDVFLPATPVGDMPATGGYSDSSCGSEDNSGDSDDEPIAPFALAGTDMAEDPAPGPPDAPAAPAAPMPVPGAPASPRLGLPYARAPGVGAKRKNPETGSSPSAVAGLHGPFAGARRKGAGSALLLSRRESMRLGAAAAAAGPAGTASPSSSPLAGGGGSFGGRPAGAAAAATTDASGARSASPGVRSHNMSPSPAGSGPGYGSAAIGLRIGTGSPWSGVPLSSWLGEQMEGEEMDEGVRTLGLG